MMDLLRILIAPLVWLATFSALYGLHGLLCSDASDASAGTTELRLVTAYLVAILVQGTVLIGLYHDRFAAPHATIRLISRVTGWVGLVATIWTLFPVAVLAVCI